ncbi:MAG: tetratricopeptide repeat protein, partial [Pirellulales bacterium]|nr:tetratricopeptide repeat protein [Pirellulales bacterium]
KQLDDANGAMASRLHRIGGDYHALTGDGPAAREAYRKADACLGARGSHNEQTAHRGAHSRSTEQFLRLGQWDRAAREIFAWQNEFPSDKSAGYLSLLYARYWAGRQKHEQAVALAEQLLAVNPDSPHADQLLLLAADCAAKQGRPARAAAMLAQLIKDYPGSPLVPEARRRLQHDEP